MKTARTAQDFVDAQNLLAFARECAAQASFIAFGGKLPETHERLMIESLEKVAERFGYRITPLNTQEAA